MSFQTQLGGVAALLALSLPAFAQEEAVVAAPQALSIEAEANGSLTRAPFVSVYCFRPWLSSTLDWGVSSNVQENNVEVIAELYFRGRKVDSASDNTRPYYVRKNTAGVDGSGAWEVRATMKRFGHVVDTASCTVT